MTANFRFQKALLLLDRGKVEDGESQLRQSIQAARPEGDKYTLGRALCCLGDLMCESDRLSEAHQILQEFQQEELPADDVLNEERARVRELLAAISNRPTDSK